jgi:hypothetical protein
VFQLVRIVSDDLKVRRGNNQVNSGALVQPTTQHEMAVGRWKRLTEPIERKKPNVAALLSMY